MQRHTAGSHNQSLKSQTQIKFEKSNKSKMVTSGKAVVVVRDAGQALQNLLGRVNWRELWCNMVTDHSNE